MQQLVFRAQRRTGIGTGMGRAYVLDTGQYRFQRDASPQWVTCAGTDLIVQAASGREVAIDDSAAIDAEIVLIMRRVNQHTRGERG